MDIVQDICALANGHCSFPSQASDKSALESPLGDIVRTGGCE